MYFRITHAKYLCQFPYKYPVICICVKASLSLVFLDFNEMEKVAFKFKDFWYNITRKKV